MKLQIERESDPDGIRYYWTALSAEEQTIVAGSACHYETAAEAEQAARAELPRLEPGATIVDLQGGAPRTHGADETRESLEQLCDRVLIERMPPSLKAAIDSALSHGATAETVLARLTVVIGGPDSRPGGLTYLACEAYIESRRKGGGS